jgi:predicted alpha/beta hydrolase family esterase
MRQVVFVQGGGAGVHDDWDIRLVEDLGRRLGAGYAIHYPRMPDEAEPHFAAWDRALRDVWSGLGANAVLVGHSVGATILLHSLAAAPLPVAPAGLFLIAPPIIGPGGWPSDEIDPAPDLGRRLPAAPLFLYHGSADEIVPPSHLELYARAIPQAVVRRLAGRDHQLGNDLAEVADDIRGMEGRGGWRMANRE